jgi:hypothetical protein
MQTADPTPLRLVIFDPTDTRLRRLRSQRPDGTASLSLGLSPSAGAA